MEFFTKDLGNIYLPTNRTTPNQFAGHEYVVLPVTYPWLQGVTVSPDVSVGNSFLLQHGPFIQDRNILS